MLESPRRSQRLSVALPVSFTRDIPHLREKTSRAGNVARALGMFRVEEAMIYNDRPGDTSEKEGRLFEKLLLYQETPQYIRRSIFTKDPDLQFAGILPPLRLASHPNREEPKTGMIREAIVTAVGPPTLVDAGFARPVAVRSKLKHNDRVTIRLTRIGVNLEGEIVDRSRLPIYWGFRVTRTGSTLGRLIRGEQKDLTISTSRKGTDIREVLTDLTVRWKTSKRVLVLFGSPDQGVPEILRREGIEVNEASDFNVNSIPLQGVETVRTEEALTATLSVMNVLEER